jgi:hypothetical protein
MSEPKEELQLGVNWNGASWTTAGLVCGTHEYETAPGGSFYHKGDNQNVSYATLYCAKCGDTKEIIVKDKRQVDKSWLKLVGAVLAWVKRDEATQECTRCHCEECDALREAAKDFRAEDAEG